MIEIPHFRSIEETSWRSECTVSTQTRKELQELRKACAEAMAALDAENEALAARIKSLQRQRKELADRIQKLDSSTALWKVLPQELWSRIFEFTQAGERVRLGRPSDTDKYRIKKSTFPDRVCFLWRQIALRSPSLYTRVDVIYSDADGKAEWDDQTGQAVEVIARGARQLYLYFDGLGAEYTKEYFRKLVTASASRLESLEVAHYDADMDILTAVSSSLPMLPLLKHFEECFYNNVSDLLWFYLPSIDSRCAQITSMTIGSCLTDSRVNVQPAVLLRLLRSCPQLHRCQFALRRAEEDVAISIPVSTAQTTHSNLKDLTLTFWGQWPQPEGASFILDALALPALEDIYLHSISAVIHPRNIVPFIERSRCTLLSFNLSNQPLRNLRKTELHRLLVCLTSVHEISIDIASFMPPSTLNKIANAELLPNNVAESRWEGKNGSDVKFIGFKYRTTPDWTPPELSEEWKKKFKAGRRWRLRPVGPFLPDDSDG